MKIYIYSVLMQGEASSSLARIRTPIACLPGLCVARSKNEAIEIALEYAKKNSPQNYISYSPDVTELDPSKILSMLKSLDAWEWISNEHEYRDGEIVVKR